MRSSRDVGPEAWFYEPPHAQQPPFCQGDVVELKADFPHIDEGGVAAAGNPVARWVVLGNSCDLDRSAEDAPWTPLLPLYTVTEDDLSRLADLRHYRPNRVFYFPPAASSEGHGHFVEFTQPTACRRTGLKSARVVKRLSQKGWALFHACLVRYLGRYDGRNARRFH